MTRKMKDSGIEWVGLIPDSWKTFRIKNVLMERKEKNNPILTKTVLSLLRNKGVIPYSEKGNIGNKAKEDVSKYKVAYPNDIIMNSMNVIIGSVNLSSYKGAVSPVYHVLHKRESLDSNINYINYLFQTNEFQDSLRGIGNGILEHRMRIPMNKLNDVVLPFPSKKEQNKIAELLDNKIWKITNLTKETQESIIQLKSYKQSIITEAVTKGLNPNVEMKDSGIEWIGKTPDYWKRTKLKNVLEIPITDGPHETPSFINKGVPFISAEAIKEGKIDFDLKRGYISEEDHYKYSQKTKPKFNDIFMIKSGATTGNTAIVKTNKVFNIWSPLALIRAKESLVLSSYLFYYLQSDSFQTQVQQFWNYGTQQNIGMGVLANLFIAFSSIIEQQEIVEYLDEKTSLIDKLIEDKTKLIEELENYKKSVIYEYVTGKKEA